MKPKNPHAQAMQQLSAMSGKGSKARHTAASIAGKASQSKAAKAKRKATLERKRKPTERPAK